MPPLEGPVIRPLCNPPPTPILTPLPPPATTPPPATGLKGGPCKAMGAEDEEEGAEGTMPLILLPTPPVLLVVVLPEGGKGEDCGTGGGGKGELSPPPPRPSSPHLGLVLMLRLLGLWCPFVVMVVVGMIMLGGVSFSPVGGAVAPAAASLSSWPEGGAVDMDFEWTRRCKSVVIEREGKGRGLVKA